jgi:hypothetical protein
MTVSNKLREFVQHFEQQQREKDEMYRQIGRAIVSLSVVEELMAAAFVALSAPMVEDQAGAKFYETQNITHKLKLLDYAIMKTEWFEGKKKWPSLSAKIAKQKWIRNAAAHSSLGFRFERDAKKWHVKLTGQEFDRKRDSTLEIAVIQSAASELEALSRLMQKFLVQTLAYSDFKIG